MVNLAICAVQQVAVRVCSLREFAARIAAILHEGMIKVFDNSAGLNTMIRLLENLTNTNKKRSVLVRCWSQRHRELRARHGPSTRQADPTPSPFQGYLVQISTPGTHPDQPKWSAALKRSDCDHGTENIAKPLALGINASTYLFPPDRYPEIDPCRVVTTVMTVVAFLMSMLRARCRRRPHSHLDRMNGTAYATPSKKQQCHPAQVPR